MVLNYSKDNSAFSRLNTIHGTFLKRRSKSDPLLNSKKKKPSRPAGFPYQWGVLKGYTQDGRFQIDETVPTVSSNQQKEREKDDVKGNVKTQDQGSLTNDLLFEDKTEPKNKIVAENTKCKICMNTQEFDKTAECTFRHNTNRRKLNNEMLCLDAEATKKTKNWTSMGLSEKFPYYYITHTKKKLSQNGFNNFYCFLHGLEDNRTRLNLQEAQRIWNMMSYYQKLPFICEAYLSHMADLPSEPDIEDDLKIFFRNNRK